MEKELDYKGMTVNERLYLSALSEDFDQAIKSKNVEKVIQILKEIQLTDENIKPIVEKYGLLTE